MIPKTPRSSILIIIPGSYHGTLTIGVDELEDKACNMGILDE